MNEELELDLIDILAAIRRFKDVSQGDVAKSLGVTSSQVVRIDGRQSHATIEQLQKYADHLDIKIRVVVDFCGFQAAVPVYLKRQEDYPRLKQKQE